MEMSREATISNSRGADDSKRIDASGQRFQFSDTNPRSGRPVCGGRALFFGNIRRAAGREVRENADSFSLQVIDRRAAEVVEIVRQNLRRELNRDAVRAFEQEFAFAPAAPESVRTRTGTGERGDLTVHRPCRRETLKGVTARGHINVADPIGRNH
jgi:hypothetical protein